MATIAAVAQRQRHQSQKLVSKGSNPLGGIEGERMNDPVVCYCGLYEKCHLWNKMTDEQRQACFEDKRMTVQREWKTNSQ